MASQYHDKAIQTAQTFGCTAEQAAAQYRANAADMRKYSDLARDAGRKYRGFTADEWNAKALTFENYGYVME